LLRSSRKLTSPRGLSGVITISAAITPTPIGRAAGEEATSRSCEPPGRGKMLATAAQRAGFGGFDAGFGGP
jgi:hypothetical protein